MSEPSTETGLQPVAAETSETSEAQSPNPFLRPASANKGRFALLYGTLGVVLVAAVGGFIVLVARPGHHVSAPWSTWKPTAGTTANVTHQIAQHVAGEYHLNKKGNPLVAVIPGPPTISSGTHKIAISNIAVKPLNASKANIQVTDSSRTWVDQFCGLGTACAIASGTPSVERGRLVRREALEVALYTFKFEPSIKSVVAFMPPAKGSTASTLLFLQKNQFSHELSTPLNHTLTLAKPPLPTQSDAKEAALIDKLTLPSIYSFSVQQLQDSSALLVLDPIPDT